MATRKQVLFFLVLGYCLQAFGQVPRAPINCPTPDIAALGTFGSVPVSLYTGQPNLSIPLYEIKEGSVSVPISLDYHLASVKPNRHSSWVGLGWGLTSGGYITRNVRGMMDEKKYGYLSGKSYSNYAPGFYAHRTKLNYITNDSILKEYGKYAQYDMGQEYELMADEFSFNFCGYSGNFYLNQDGGWTVACDQDIQVVFNESDGFIDAGQLRTGGWGNQTFCNRFFNKFTLITPDGARYTFGGKANATNSKDDAVEYSISYYNRNSSDLIPTSWYLTKIETPEGRTVSLTYTAGDPVCELKYSPFSKSLNNIYCNPTPHITGYQALSGYLLFPVYLTAITTSLETVTFHALTDDSGRPDKLYLIPSSTTTTPRSQPGIYENYGLSEDYGTLIGNMPYTEHLDELKTMLYEKLNWRLLNAISIQSNLSGGLSKTYYFQYNFYNNNKNKILEALTERSGAYQACDATSLPPYPDDYTPQEYHFSYYDLYSLFSHPTMDREDTWGYYMSTIPYTLETTLNTIISGKPYSSLSCTKAGTLQSIQYPTGGKTVFDYELNDYSKCVNSSFVELETNNYNSTGGGLRVSQLTTYSNLRTITQVKKYYYTRDSVPGKDNGQKSSGILKRKAVYQSFFQTNDQIQYLTPQVRLLLGFIPIVEFAVQNPGTANMQITQTGGFLMQTTNDNTPFIGYSSVIEHTLDGSGNSNGYVRYRFSNYDDYVHDDDSEENHLDGSYLYSNVPGDNYANSVSSRAQERGKLMAEDHYDATGTLKKSVRNHYQPSDANSFLTLNQEAIFFCTDPYQCAVMLSAFYTHIYSYLLDKQTVTEYPDAGVAMQTETRYAYNARKLPSATTVLRSDGKKQTTQLIYPFELTSGPDVTVLNKMTTKHVISDYVSKLTYLDEAPAGQVIDGEYRTYREIVANSSLFRPERIDRLPKGTPVSIGSVVSHSGSSVTLSTASFQPEVNCLYDSYGNPTEYKPVGSNLPTAYLWGYNAHYPIAEIKNATYEQANTTLPATAQATRYTYKPLVGIATITDPHEVTTYYRYDVLNRLQTIKDDTDDSIKDYEYHYKHHAAELMDGTLSGPSEIPNDESNKIYRLSNFIHVPGNNLSEICRSVTIVWRVSSNLQIDDLKGDCFTDVIYVSPAPPPEQEPEEGTEPVLPTGPGWINVFISFKGETLTLHKDIQLIPPRPMEVEIIQGIAKQYFLAQTSLPATTYEWVFNSQVVSTVERVYYDYDDRYFDPAKENTLTLTASDGSKTGSTTITVYGNLLMAAEEETLKKLKIKN